MAAGRYRIVEQAGAGGMGVVYRAVDETDGRSVALKVLAVSTTPADIERFERGAQILARFRHPHIVAHLGNGALDDGRRFMVMEWLSGESLAATLERGAIGVGATLELALRTADALANIHEQSVIHRDIKPENLFLPDGRIDAVQIVDFDIATIGTVASVTAAGQLLGTPAYMAPEQARGDRGLGPAVDVFALGCVLFECIGGRPLFTGDSIIAILAKVLFEDAPDVRTVAPHTPPAFASLIARMVSKDPLGRPASGRELHTALTTLDQTSAPEQGARAEASRVLTRGEMRLVGVVLATVPVSPAVATEITLPGSEEVRIRVSPSLRASIENCGARLEQLRDGSLVAVVTGQGSATHQAVRAARCALAMRRECEGVVVSVAMGRALLDGPLPLGEAIDRAAAMVTHASIGTIRCDDVTAGLLGSAFEIGGDAEGLVLVAERAETDEPRVLLGESRPCVGRDAEVSTIVGLFEACIRDSAARAALVTGAPGIGKSRLRYEAVRAIREREPDVEVWVGRGDPMATNSPGGLVARITRRAIGIADGEPSSVRVQKLRAHVMRHRQLDTRRVATFLGELLDVPFGDPGDVQLRAAKADPILMGDQMKRAWLEWIEAECSVQPVLVALDDVDSSDQPTTSLLDAALRRLRDLPLMLLATARPDVESRFPDLARLDELVTIRLGPLSRKSSERLIRHALGPSVDDVVVERLVARGGGNAYYLEELARAVSRRSELAADVNALPDTVFAMVQARLEGLEPEARRVLRAASVFGEAFWPGGVASLVGSTVADLEPLLEQLVRGELIAKRHGGRFPGEDEFAFRSGVVRDTAYSTLTAGDLVAGHRLAASWLEAAGASEPTVLAMHYERGERGEDAARWYTMASERALRANDLQQVLALADRAIGCGASGPSRGEVLWRKSEAQRWSGKFAEAKAEGLAAIPLLPKGRGAWSGAIGEVALAAGALGDHATLQELGDALMTVDPASAEPGPLVVAMARVGVHSLHAGRLDRASELLGRIESIAASLPTADPTVSARTHQVRAFMALFNGDPGQYLAETMAAAKQFATAGDDRNVCAQKGNLGYANLEVGRADAAETAMRETIDTAERLGLANYAATALHNLGLALARQGRLAEARVAEQSALDRFVAQKHRRMEAASRIYLAEIYRASRDLEHAEREARQAIEGAASLPPTRAYAMAVLANVLLAKGDPSGAFLAATEARETLRQLGQMDAGEALVRLVWAEALHATGRDDEAREAIREAHDRLRARASAISDPSLRSSFLENVPENVRTFAIAKEWRET